MTEFFETEQRGTAAEAAWDTRQLNPSRLAAIEEFAGESLIDIGCGNGAYVLALKDQMQTFGADIRRYDSWDTAPELFTVCDAAGVPVDDNSFDTVTSFEVLEHLPDPLTTLREFVRIARRNVIITVPNCDIPKALVDSRLTFFHYTDRSHVNFFTEQSLRELCESAGLRVVRFQLINSCNVRALVSDLMGIQSKFVNRLVGRLCRKEYRMTCLLVGELVGGGDQ